MKPVVSHRAGGREVLAPEDAPDPGEPGAGDVRVAVHGDTDQGSA